MSYQYEVERAKIFTEENQEMFITIRENAVSMIRHSGCATLGKLISKVTGDSFTMMACVDRLVELKTIREVDYGPCTGQNRIFILA